MGTRLDPVNELNHYYKDTILSITKDGIKYPFYANEFQKGDAHTYLVCNGSIAIKDAKGVFMWAPHVITADELNYEHPEMGYHNMCQCAYYVERSPERQYKKGASDRTLSFHRKAPAIEYVEIYYSISPQKTNDVEKWYSVFNPKYYSIDEIISKLDSCEIYSGALSPKYAIIPLANSDKLSIGYKHTIVGFLEGNIGVLPKNNEHLVESLSEYLKVKVV